MKSILEFSVKLVASLAVFSFTVFSAVAQTPVERTGRVNAIAGDARFSSKGGPYQPLSVGQRLYSGDSIKTGAGSHVDLDVGANVGALQVAPQSTFVLDKLTVTEAGSERLTETQLKVEMGAIYAKINKLGKGSRYEIATPKGIAGIRGSAAYVTADCQVTMLEGLAGVAFPTPAGPVNTFLVHGGETVSPTDTPPHPAPPELLRDIVEALRDACTHGIGTDIRPFAQLPESFISPVLPVRIKVSRGVGIPTNPE